MATFTVREVEGMRQVQADLDDDTIRTRRGMLSNLRGDIKVTAQLPGLRDIFRSLFTDEARVRPSYSGRGTVNLQPSIGGFHVFDAEGERWILEPGVYVASDGDVELGLFRERMLQSFWAGDGLLVWKTTIEGHGHVVIDAPGPVEVVDVEHGELRVQGRIVLGRTEGLRFSSRRASTFLRSFLVGQRRLRVFSGRGKALVCWTPYWNQHMYERMTGERIQGSLFE
jgi:uncharacterized protein (AIM24 family)